jgi:L-asparaginase
LRLQGEEVYGYADAGSDVLRGIITTNPDGIVAAGTGNGNISTPHIPILKEAARGGIVVVRSSRTGTGMVTPDPHIDQGIFVTTDTLNPQKSRILLMLALTDTRNPKEIQRIFYTY